jgi:hypothetical protein
MKVSTGNGSAIAESMVKFLKVIHKFLLRRKA